MVPAAGRSNDVEIPVGFFPARASLSAVARARAVGNAWASIGRPLFTIGGWWTYRQTIQKFEGDPAVNTLRQIQSEHEYAAELLRNNVLEMGGEPSTDSGAWGAFANAVQGVAKAFGESSALKGLQQGEEHGLDDYEDALEDEDVMPACKDMIRSELLPRTRQHVTALQQIAAAR